MTRTTRLGRVILAAVGALALFSVVAKAEGLPKIAVTDLAYEEKVASHFTIVAANEKAGTPGYYSPWGGGPERSIVAASGEIILIERGELH